LAVFLVNRLFFENPKRLPEADQIYDSPYQDILQKLEFDDNTYVIIVTHQHTHDQEILEYCVQKPLAYLGMIGSKTKVEKVFNMLRDQGINEELIKKIHSPIGLDIGAETPEEIALAIAAELVAVRKGRSLDLHVS
jgi:xanthine dehydrogenase accessory factor